MSASPATGDWGPNLVTQQIPLLPTNIDPAPQDLPAAAEGLGPTEVQRIGQFLEDSVASNLTANCRLACNTFEKWAKYREALGWPASLDLAPAHVSYLADGREMPVPGRRIHRFSPQAVPGKSARKALPVPGRRIHRFSQPLATRHQRHQ